MRWGMRDLAMDPIHMAVNDRPGNRAMLHRWMQPPISCSMYLGRYKLIEQIIFSMIILNDHFVKKSHFIIYLSSAISATINGIKTNTAPPTNPEKNLLTYK